jgi:predicted 3-demethylubiquinone-9 3-methyltransferase (glyoxalase superfamily)
LDRISPFLWFDNQAEEAAKFYVSIFKNSKINHVTRRPENVPGPKGEAMLVSFELDRQPYLAMNGGPQFKFTEAISMLVNCETQAEIDYYWEKLTADGGKEVQCGWLKDKYGLFWQVAPSGLGRLMSDPEAAKRVMAEVMSMVKLDIAKMEKAAKG